MSRLPILLLLLSLSASAAAPPLADPALSYALEPSAERLLVLARKEEDRGARPVAWALLRRLLAEDPQGAIRDEAEERLGRLSAQLAPAPVPVEIAQEQVNRGVTAFREAQLEEAGAALALAYALAPDGALLYNLAAVQRRLLRPELSLRLYRRYLSEATGEAGERAEAERQVRALTAQLAPPAPAKLVIREEPRRRPLWRLVGGGIGAAAGIALLSAGAQGLAVDGSCAEAPVAPSLVCDRIFDSRGPGAGLVAAGGALLLGGVLLLALPPPRRTTAARAAAPRPTELQAALGGRP